MRRRGGAMRNQLAILVVLAFATAAQAYPKTLEWTHPLGLELDGGTLVVMQAGSNIGEVAINAADLEAGIFAIPFLVTAGEPIRVVVIHPDGRSSEPSNPQTFGDECADWDANGDGVLSIADAGAVRAWFASAALTTVEFSLFRQFFSDPACQ